MDIRLKESIKELPIEDFIVQLKQEEILAAAEKAGYQFGAKLSKKVLVERLAQVYRFFPQQVRKCLSEQALSLLSRMAQNGCEASADEEGAQELASMGIAMILEDRSGQGLPGLAVTSRDLMEKLKG
ncbi:MAG: hypothetical protein ACOX8S_11105 [Christensenellales bacterium]